MLILDTYGQEKVKKIIYIYRMLWRYRVYFDHRIFGVPCTNNLSVWFLIE